MTVWSILRILRSSVHYKSTWQNHRGFWARSHLNNHLPEWNVRQIGGDNSSHLSTASCRNNQNNPPHRGQEESLPTATVPLNAALYRSPLIASLFSHFSCLDHGISCCYKVKDCNSSAAFSEVLLKILQSKGKQQIKKLYYFRICHLKNC